MSLGWRLYAHLPTSVQRLLADIALTTSAGRRYLDLALRSLEAFGGDRFLLDEMCRELRHLDDLGPRAAEMAARLAERGEQALVDGHRLSGAEYLRQATLFYAIADRLAAPAWRAGNFARLVTTADRMRGLEAVPTRRIVVGGCPAYFRIPPAPVASGGGVVIVQGTNTSKDMFFALEQQLLDRGLAVLTIDQPGSGESLLLGRRIHVLSELAPVAAAIWEFAERHADARMRRIGVFGFSLGGIVAPALCALDQRFAACAMIATGLRVDTATLEREPPQLKARALYVAGVSTWAEARDIAVRGLDLRPLASQVRCPVRAFHGACDSILPVDGAHALFNALGSAEHELTVVPGGDHTCSRVLRSEVLPTLFDWLADKLA